MRKLKVVVAFFFVALIAGMFHLPAGVHASAYSANAVWIQDAAWPRFPASKDNILSKNLSGLVSDLSNNYVEFAIVFVGYWNATTPSKPTISYQHNAAFYQNVISAFHAKGIKVIAWAENGGGGTMNLTAGNVQNAYNATIACMNIGFDGYNDDIESNWNQDWINYLNSLTTVLHNETNFTDGKSRLNMPDVPYDYQQIFNPSLYVDYIVSMFYSGTSTLENSQAAAYWQEDFGEYQKTNDTPPASPMIMGLMNHYGNKYPLTWQLGQVDKYLLDYGHPQLAGFCIWLYEYMGTNANDWNQWNYWIARVGTNTPSLYVATITSSPVTGIQLTVNGTQHDTPNIQYGFNGTVIILQAPPSITQYTFLNWSNGANGTTLSVTLTSNTTITAIYTPAIPEHNVPVLPAPFMTAMAITMLLVILTFKKNKKQHSSKKF